MNVALVQIASSATESISTRRQRVAEMIKDAAGADLMVLPELWPSGYFAFHTYSEAAESMDGATVTAAREWARQLGCHIHLGSVLEQSADGRIYNTAILLNPAGLIIHQYRKIHVFSYRSLEANLLSCGRDASVVQTAFGPLATATCYDLRFPELWRHLVDQGAKLVITPAAWPSARLSHWKIFTSCRAIEEQVIVIAVNAVGVQGGNVRLGGHSRVVDPWGDVVGEAGIEEGVTIVDVDLDVVDRARAEFPVLADRRLSNGGEGTNSLLRSVERG